MNIKNVTISGKQVGGVGLGCMGMSEFYGESNEVDCLAILRKSFDLGYRHYDTADMYGRGKNEKLLGKFIKEISSTARDEIVISSKVGIVRDASETYKVSVSNDPEYIKKSCEETLKRLNIECLDLYYLHRLAAGYDVADVMGCFQQLIDEGKIKAVGLCEVDADTLQKASESIVISALQSEYSLWTREIENSVLQKCEELNIPFVAFSPLGRGFLTGAISQDDTFSMVDDLRSRLPRFSEKNLKRNCELIEEYGKYADFLKQDRSQLALSWVLSKSPLIHVIPGTRREKYLMSNYEAQSVRLSLEEIGALDDMFNEKSIWGARYPTAIHPGK